MCLSLDLFCVGVLSGLVAKSCLTLVISWMVTCQTPLSMKFFQQEYWSGLSFPSPEDHPDPGMILNPSLLRCRQILYCGATREAPGVLCTPFNFFLFKSPRCVTLYLLNKNSHFCCDFSPPLHHIPRILVSQPGIEPRLQQ